MHSCAHATGLPLPPVVCLLVTMGMDMNEWLIAWIKQCAQSARLSGFNPHGNHGIAWSCSVEDYRALLWHMGIASMVLLQAVRAGCAPRCAQPRRPGHCLCVGLGDFTWL